MRGLVAWFVLVWAACAAGALEVDGLTIDLYNDKAGAQKTIFILKTDRLGTASDGPAFVPALVKKGWLVVYLDLPGTGADLRQTEAPHGNHTTSILSVWAARIATGENVVNKYTLRLRQVLDQLITEGHVNQNYLYIYGQGAGGFMALQAAALDGRFKAVLCSQPVCDLNSFGGFAATPAALRHTLAVKEKRDFLADKVVRLWFGPQDTLNRTEDAYPW